MLAEVLFAANVLLGFLDLCLIAPAIVHADKTQVRGRLVGLGLLLIGLSSSSAQRLAEGVGFTIGLPFITVGLVVVALFLPDLASDRRQLIDSIRRRNR